MYKKPLKRWWKKTPNDELRCIKSLRTVSSSKFVVEAVGWWRDRRTWYVFLFRMCTQTVHSLWTWSRTLWPVSLFACYPSTFVAMLVTVLSQRNVGWTYINTRSRNILLSWDVNLLLGTPSISKTSWNHFFARGLLTTNFLSGSARMSNSLL